MTIRERHRIHPVTAHAYTVPIVREVPISPGQSPLNGAPAELEQPRRYAADSHAW